ncbi:hypothetical protein MMC28_002637 [Mycoblastus sanguinarius]|nr:hypothetical protein [Mycoblastus sanguinarius]
MADVRSLLRSERAQRRVDHPLATYSATGTLECIVCRIPLKSDIEVWNKHLKSTQHAMRQERLRLSTSRPPPSQPKPGGTANGGASTREVSGGSKKRKADDGDDDSRKRTRPAVHVPGGFFDEIIETNNADAKEPEKPSQSASAFPETSEAPEQQIKTPQINEDEWAAFERDVATPPPDLTAPSTLMANATISAAPLSAAEIAAQSRDQASMQSKERREAEVEGEKEDAARALEEEFDEMEGLEERVRRLREKREELRIRRAIEAEGHIEDEEAGGEGGQEGDKDEGMGQEDGGSEDDEDEDDSWGIWKR